MGRIRRVFCIIAKWTFWPAIRGWILAAIISVLLIAIALLFAGARWLYQFFMAN